MVERGLVLAILSVPIPIQQEQLFVCVCVRERVCSSGLCVVHADVSDTHKASPGWLASMSDKQRGAL